MTTSPAPISPEAQYDGQKGEHPRPHFGLVCITYTDQIRYRALTRKRLLQFAEAEQQELLRELYADNLKRLAGAIDYCIAHAIRLYRFSAKLFPFDDTPLGAAILDEFTADLATVGQRALTQGIRLLVHPEQFIVLNSESPQVVENSMTMLAAHGRLMDLLQQPRSPWAPIEIHGGKGGRGAELAAIIGTLPDPVRTRLVLENDEYAYSAAEILAVCQAAGVPMVFDAHHHICHEKLASYDHPSMAALIAAARATWPDPRWQVLHISNGRESFADRRHSDIVTAMPEAYWQAEWIEVEAKHKEEAIKVLRRQRRARSS
jgi:UV DNA damage endonuclease